MRTGQGQLLTIKMKLVVVVFFIFLADEIAVAGKTHMSLLGYNNLSGRPSCGVGHFTCCNGKVYYPPHEMCCFPLGWGMPGEILNAPFRGSQCCGNKTYDTRSQLCCDGVVRASSRATAMSCCGTEAYTISSRTCCGGKLHPKANRIGVGCCGDQQYSYNRHLCCSGVLFLHARDQACCHKTAYNWRDQICCQRRLFPNVRGQSWCCGSESCHPQ